MGVQRITKLTPEQRAAMAPFAQKWIEIGLATGEADWQTFDRNVRRCYEFTNLNPPKGIIHVSSPLVIALAAPIASLYIELLKNPPKNLKAVDSAVRSAVRDALSRMWSWNYFGGHLWNWWNAYTAFYRDVCQLYLPGDLWERNNALEGCQVSVGYWFCHRDFVIASNKPRVLHLDDRGRLHSATGAAIQYPDGWGLYCWHGVRVPEDVILTPELLTADRIEKEPNAEVRRVMVERMGYERYILESGATLVHSDETGALYRKEFSDDEPLNVVHVLNSTPEPDGSVKRYALRVPPNITRAREAVAWTFNVPEAEYRPLVET